MPGDETAGARQTLSDHFRYTARITEMELEEAEKRYDGWLDRRVRSSERLNAGNKRVNANPANDFDYSKIMTALTSGSGSFWVTGIGYACWPLWKTMAASPIWLPW